MLGVHPELVSQLVETGQARLVFWPVLNHGGPSVYASLAAQCAGEQDPALFWPMHAALFENQNQLYSADRDYFVNTAVSVGVEQAAFESCYDNPDSLAALRSLDTIRGERGVFSQPQFDLNDNRLIGYQTVETFVEAVNLIVETQNE